MTRYFDRAPSAGVLDMGELTALVERMSQEAGRLTASTLVQPGDGSETGKIDTIHPPDYPGAPPAEIDTTTQPRNGEQ